MISGRPWRAPGMPSRQDLVAALARVAEGERAAWARLYAGTCLKLYGPETLWP